MKKLFFILLVVSALTSCQNDQIDEMPADSNPELKASYSTEASLRTAIANAKPGDVISISGTIKLTGGAIKCSKSGTSSKKITFQYGTLDCSGLPSGSRGVEVSGSYWVIKHMTIRNAPDNGILLMTGGYNSVSNCTISRCGDTGIQIYSGGHHNTISYCNSSENYDPQNGGENADGFACKLGAGPGNKFDHCVANHNSDDGWDLIDQPYTVVITNCTATNHGYGANGDGNGFKLGGANQSVPHTVTNCTASYNKAYGYDGNGNKGHITTTGSGGTGNVKGLWSRIY